jgi:opacity protein-like surface antigen
MTLKAVVRATTVTLAALSLCAAHVRAQQPVPEDAQQPAVRPRVFLSGSGGYFIDLGGFAAPPADSAFFTFDNAIAFGGGVHVAVSPGVVVGLDAVYAKPDYQKRDRRTGDAESSGRASVASGLLSMRLNTAGGGRFNLYLTAGAGVFAYDVPEPVVSEWDKDLAAMAGAGLEYRLIPRFAGYFEWTQFWAYHQKEGNVRNTAKHNLLRLGARVGI